MPTGTVTLLFTDLVDSTVMSQRLGEDGAELFRRTHFRLLREAVAAHNGQEVKNLGDGLMVAFGSALDATRCAIAMQQAVERHNRRDGQPFAVRVGLHVGEPIRDEEDYFGTPVVVAKRLCDSAGAGQIFASNLVRELVGARSGLTLRPLEPRALKGLSEPVAICEVSWEPAPQAAPSLPRMAVAGGTPFVGREREVATLGTMLQETVLGGGRVALIAGEPGIGKTRLTAEVAERAAAEGWLVLFGRAYESEGAPPYLPFIEALGGYLRTVPDVRLASELGDHATQLALILPDIARRLPDLPKLPPLDPDSERYRLFEAVCDYLTDRARAPGACGMLLALEDLHWADESTLLLLEHMARRLPDAPIALLLNYRDTEAEPGRPLARALGQLMRLTSCEQLALRRLDWAGVSFLLAGLSSSEPPARLVEVVYSETEGNPLFVQEVYRYLADEGRLFDEAGHWRSDVGVGEVEIPRSVRLVIGLRLQHVSDPCRRALTFAAIIGRVFDFDLLSDVSETTEAELLDAMDEAERAHLVTGGHNHGGAELMFTHELIRQTLAGDLSLPRRRAVHISVAEAIERLHAHRLDPYVSELARHYSFGGRAAHAEKAVEYATRAARQASVVYAHRDAVRHHEMALESLDRVEAPDARRHCDLLIDLARALLSAGEPSRAADLAEQAYAIAESLHDDARASTTCRSARLALLHSVMGAASHTDIFRKWAARAERHASAGSLDRAAACVMLADTLVVTARRSEGWLLYREAFQLAKAFENAELMYDTATQVGGWGAAPATERERYDIMLDALARPKAISTETLGRFLLYEGLNHLDWADPERGLSAWEELVALSTRCRNAYLTPFAARTEVLTAVIQGRFEDALGAADHLIACAEESGAPVGGRMMASNVVHRALLHLGRPREALAGLDEALKVGGLSELPTGLLAARLVTLAALASDEACRHELRELLEAHRPDADGENWATHVFLAELEASIALGDAESVSRLSSIVAPAANLGLGFLFLGTPARVLGDAAAFLGKPSEAREWYTRAIDIAEKIAFRPEVALARLALAELIADHFRPELAEAHRQLLLAIPELQAMKMASAMERALALQERLAGRTPARIVYPDGLTQREVEVLRLIALGRSSKEIGEELVLSVRTVERHIANIYLKTGTPSRVAAVTYASAHGLLLPGSSLI